MTDELTFPTVTTTRIDLAGEREGWDRLAAAHRAVTAEGLRARAEAARLEVAEPSPEEVFRRAQGITTGEDDSYDDRRKRLADAMNRHEARWRDAEQD